MPDGENGDLSRVTRVSLRNKHSAPSEREASARRKFYVPSRYNHFLRDGDRWLGANLLSGAVMNLRDDDCALVHRLLAMKVRPRQLPERVLYDMLVKSRFLVPADSDETAYLKQLFAVGKQCRVGFSLGLVVTLACNFRCVYCYQDHRRAIMGTDVQDAVMALLRKALPGKEHFTASWFGGEPLLKPRVITDLGRRMIQLCDSLGVNYDCVLTTNGYLLTRANIAMLAAGRVSHIQITLDGPRELHDVTRHLQDGSGTYEVIMANLGNLVRTLPEVPITIRCNITASSMAAGEHAWSRLLSDLEPYRRSVSLTICPAIPSRTSNAHCISKSQFGDFYGHVSTMMEERGFRVASDGPSPGAVSCGAIPRLNWLIGPTGHVSKCTVGADETDGYLGRLGPDGTIDLSAEAARWLNFSPFRLKKCRECSVLPLCMGGCVIVPFDDPHVDRCDIKTNVLMYVKSNLPRKEVIDMTVPQFNLERVEKALEQSATEYYTSLFVQAGIPKDVASKAAMVCATNKCKGPGFQPGGQALQALVTT